MPAIHYQALDADGRKVSGVLDADTPRQARSQLRAQGLLPVSVVDQTDASTARKFGRARRVSATELSMLTRQLATLLDSGLTMEQTLNALIEQAATPVSRDVLTGVKAEITAGHSLATALGVYPASFPDFYCALVQDRKSTRLNSSHT